MKDDISVIRQANINPPRAEALLELLTAVTDDLNIEHKIVTKDTTTWPEKRPGEVAGVTLKKTQIKADKLYFPSPIETIRA